MLSRWFDGVDKTPMGQFDLESFQAVALTTHTSENVFESQGSCNKTISRGWLRLLQE